MFVGINNLDFSSIKQKIRILIQEIKYILLKKQLINFEKLDLLKLKENKFSKI